MTATSLPMFPARTPPTTAGMPRYILAGESGPPACGNEKRRHIYRQGDIPVRIKMIGESDVYEVYRVIDDWGDLGWQYAKPEGFKSCPFFVNDNPFDGRANILIYWPEGEKDVETLACMGLPAFTFGGTNDGLPDGCAAYVAGRHVAILADNDEAGRKHAEDKAMAIHDVAASVRIIHFPDTADKGDVSDWLAAGHTTAELVERVSETAKWNNVIELQQSSQPVTNASAIADTSSNPADLAAHHDERFDLPLGYRFHDNGLYWRDPNDEEKSELHLSSAFDIIGETRDGHGSSRGLLLHWIDHDGYKHRFILPRAMLAGDGAEARKTLLDGGMYISPGSKVRQLFNAFLLQLRSPVRIRTTQQIGWHGNTFVMPEECYGATANDSLLLQTTTAHGHAFRQTGTLENWQQNIARYASGNSRLALAISAAFAGPLVGPCSAEGGGIHFRGASSTGKSTALHVAGSVWGGGDINGFVRSWRATANGLEVVALGHSDTLLCLDELSQLTIKDAGEAAYMLANGSGKSRSSRNGSACKAAYWRIIFVSSGEISLADKVAEDGRGQKLSAGQQVRVIDVPADAGAGYGLFETLHDFPSAEAFARHLRAATQQHYGVAARVYLKMIVAGIDDIRKTASSFMQAFIKQYVPSGADGQVERVGQRFALVAAGGEIATRACILPWQPGEAIKAAGQCFKAWLAQRGGIEPAETIAAIEQVRAFLLANGMARFIPAWEAEMDPRVPQRDVAGYRQKAGDSWDYFVTASAWREICAGLDPRHVAATLQQKEWLLTDGGIHRSKIMRVPGFGRIRLYHIPSSFLEVNDVATG